MGRGRPKEFDADVALDAAVRMFWRHGYEGCSIAALTEAMGINAPSLYGTFGSKEGLFRSVLERYLQGPASYLPVALRQPTARLVVETLFEGAIKLAINQAKPSGCLLVQGALATGPAGEVARAMLGSTRAAAESAVRRRFERARADDDLPTGVSPAKLARYVVTVIWGLSVQAAGGATRSQLQDVAVVVLRSWPG